MLNSRKSVNSCHFYRLLVVFNEKFCPGYGSAFWFCRDRYLPKIWASCSYVFSSHRLEQKRNASLMRPESRLPVLTILSVHVQPKPSCYPQKILCKPQLHLDHALILLDECPSCKRATLPDVESTLPYIYT